MNNDNIFVKIPNKADYISLVRLMSSAIGNKIGFNIDEIEDLKVAMGEACILSFVKEEKEDIEIMYTIYPDKLMVIISRTGELKTLIEETKEVQLGKMIIESLMDEAYYSDNEITIIKLID